MDVFIEKIVKKQKTAKDNLISGIIMFLALNLIIIGLIFVQFFASFFPFYVVLVVYGAYKLYTMRNIEFEYCVTNGELDIDMIIAQRKRKRIFSSNCKEFDIVAKVNSSHYNESVKNIKKQIDCRSSKFSENAYFITLSLNGVQTVVYFEPNEKMLNSFKTYIPRKLLT